jgi:Protein of unknown function (DUF3015)
MKLKLIGILFFTIFSTQAFAGNDGSSGCGPGWYILKDDSLLSSALRFTTNMILFPVSTIGMTFGTSNCTQHKLVLREKESLYFATMNQYELKRDIAKGQGEYLSAFAETMGCPMSAQSRLNDHLRSSYSTVYPTSEVQPDKVLLQVYITILSDSELTGKCSLGLG